MTEKKWTLEIGVRVRDLTMFVTVIAAITLMAMTWGCVSPGAADIRVLDADGVTALVESMKPTTAPGDVTVPEWVQILGGSLGTALATGGWVVWDRRRFHGRTNGHKETKP